MYKVKNTTNQELAVIGLGVLAGKETIEVDAAGAKRFESLTGKALDKIESESLEVKKARTKKEEDS